MFLKGSCFGLLDKVDFLLSHGGLLVSCSGLLHRSLSRHHATYCCPARLHSCLSRDSSLPNAEIMGMIAKGGYKILLIANK